MCASSWAAVTARTDISNEASRAWAVFFARVILGLIFFMAGVWKTFTLTPAGHVRRFFLPFQDTFLPTWSLWGAGAIIPIVELIAGALVIAGLFTRPALIALGFVLVVVTFGHLLHEPLYAFHEHVIPRLALLLVVMLMPAEADRYSLDAVIRSRSQS
jgi:thiosulfate dehydrogenase [quinone] large subunit